MRRAFTKLRDHAATSGGIGLVTIAVILFLPLDSIARAVLLSLAIAFLIRKSFVVVHAAHSEKQLAFEERFIENASDPALLRASMDLESKLWSRSAIVQTIRAAGSPASFGSTTPERLRSDLRAGLRKTTAHLDPPSSMVDAVFLGIWVLGWILVFSLFLPVGPALGAGGKWAIFMFGLFLFAGSFIMEWVIRPHRTSVESTAPLMVEALAAWLSSCLPSLADGDPGAYSHDRVYRDKPWLAR